MKKGSIVSGVEIVDLGAKGAVIGKKDGVVYLTKGAVPGDIVSLRLQRKRKGMQQGQLVDIEQESGHRVAPLCKHHAYCGGCSWQDLDYAQQLSYKEKNVLQQLRRIGGFDEVPSERILGADPIFYYRNKMEFTHVENRWLTPSELRSAEVEKDQGTGFHVPGRFDWVLHIDECHLQHDDHNAMRNFVHDQARALNIPFHNPKTRTGVLRNIVLRNNRQGDWMVLIIASEDSDTVKELMDVLVQSFPAITSLWFILNEKVNDTFTDCPARLVHGNEALMETFSRPDDLGKLNYLIGPKSFFQTNPFQAERLYSLIYQWAELTGTERVYDLYTGAGSIALFVANLAAHVVGIEYVPEAIADAEENARLNGVDNCSFFAGDMKEMLTPTFIAEQGVPDLIIADPPRAGMHGDVVERILEMGSKRMIYVSCDPATQARDLSLLKTKYRLLKSRAVDMFPHTSHVENVVLLELIM